MKFQTSYSKILLKTYLIFGIFSILFYNLLGYWEPRFDYYTFVNTGKYGISFYIFSVIFLFLLILRCMLKYFKQLTKSLQILFVSLVVYFLIYTCLTLMKNSIQTTLFESIATTVILFPCLFIIGFDEDVWLVLKKSIPFICLLFLFLFFYLVIDYWSTYGFIQTMNANYKQIFSYLITSTWFLFIVSDKNIILKNVMLFLLIIASFITMSRAWVLQVCILLFIYLFNKRGNKIIRVILSIILLGIFLIIISFIFPNITGNLFVRGLQDTRTGQYLIFFNKYSWSDLLLGQGLNAGYSYLGNANYPYFDNQFLFILFHYGAFPIIVFFILSFKVLLCKKNIFAKSFKTTFIRTKYIFPLILLAYLGLSTYYQIKFDYNTLLIMIIIGRFLKEIHLGGC